MEQSDRHDARQQAAATRRTVALIGILVSCYCLIQNWRQLPPAPLAVAEPVHVQAQTATQTFAAWQPSRPR